MEKLPLLAVLNELMTFYSEARQCKSDRYAAAYDLDSQRRLEHSLQRRCTRFAEPTKMTTFYCCGADAT